MIGTSNSISIVSVTSATRKQWESVARACPYATFFHTPYWAEIFAAWDRRYTVEGLEAHFSDGASAILAQSVEKRFIGLWPVAHYSPAGVYGGWIAKTPLGAPHAQAMVNFMQKRGSFIWRENPYDSSCEGLEIAGAQEDFTQTIALRGCEEPLDRGSRAHRKAVKKAQNAGVTVRMAHSREDWERYYAVYRDTISRWDKEGKRGVRYPYALFASLRKLDTSIARLWLAEIENTLAAGIVCFYWNTHAVAWHGASLGRYFSARPSNFLYYHIMEDARQRGFAWLDCNPCGGRSGVVAFKEHLGAQKKRSRICVHYAIPWNYCHRIKSALAYGMKFGAS